MYMMAQVHLRMTVHVQQICGINSLDRDVDFLVRHVCYLKEKNVK